MASRAHAPQQDWPNRIVGQGEMRAGDFLAHPLNYRIHPKFQQDATEGSLNDLGWVRDVLVNRTTGRIIDGHLRVTLALRRGEDTLVPYTEVELSEEEEAEALALLDTLTSMAVLDGAKLEELLNGFTTDNADVAAALDQIATDAGIVPGIDAGDGGDEAAEIDETAPTRTQPGDVWQVGRHTVACRDSTDRATVERLTAARKVGMVIADAPYGMELDTSYANSVDNPRKSIKASRGYAPVIGDDKPFNPTPWFDLFQGVHEQFWWGADYYRKHLPNGGSWLVWDKRASVEDVEYSSASFELCWSRTSHRRDILRVPWFGIIGMEQEGGKRVHPTQKPIKVYQALLEYGAAGDIILDPFLGSGPSLKAAERMDRTVIGFELSPHYVDHILDWAEAQGLTCELLTT